MTEIKFTIKLAGINIEVCASFLSSREFCKDYLTDEAPTLKVCMNADDIKREAEASEEKFSEQYFETLAICRKVADALIAEDVLLVHGSAVCVDGKCYIFTGPSGIGKSTHASLWKQLLADKATIINDDKPFLKISNAGVEAFGSPWSGEQNINTNMSAPLKSICFLEQSALNEISEIDNSTALEMLIPQIYKPKKPENVTKSLELTDALLKNVAFYQLKCNTDISAAKLSFDTLTN